MRLVRLGKSGLMVTSVGFGGIPIQRLVEDDAVAVVRHCLDRGVNFIDTATGYTTSEEWIGRAIAGRRQELVLATKTPARDGATARQHLERSLQRLRTEWIDLYQFHNVSTPDHLAQVLAPGGPLDVAREAQAAGKVRHIGVTSHSLDMALELVRSGHFETLMFPFNFVTDEAAQELIPLCRQLDIGFICMKPFGGGMLGNAALAFKFLRRYPDIVPIPGIEHGGEMDEIVAIMEGVGEFNPVEKAEMARVKDELGTRFCRRCGYCQPCPQGVPITSLMTMNSFLKRLPMQQLRQGFIAEAVAAADNCIKCGECEPKCPHGLPIREMMDENVGAYRAFVRI